MQIKVKSRWQKTSPRKLRNIIDVIRGNSANLAMAKLLVLSYQTAKPVRELLKSALAAAQEKDLDKDDLYIEKVFCDEGPKIKRRMYRARGRSSTIQKRMSHITMILSAEKKNKRAKKPKNKKS